MLSRRPLLLTTDSGLISSNVNNFERRRNLKIWKNWKKLEKFVKKIGEKLEKFGKIWKKIWEKLEKFGKNLGKIWEKFGNFWENLGKYGRFRKNWKN